MCVDLQREGPALHRLESALVYRAPLEDIGNTNLRVTGALRRIRFGLLLLSSEVIWFLLS